VSIEYLDEPIAVEARLDSAGGWLPLAFVWRGEQHRIQHWGRQQTRETDEARHHYFLVQTEGRNTWELRYTEGSGEWRLLRHWRSPGLAV
jgi:hypothetical protein